MKKFIFTICLVILTTGSYAIFAQKGYEKSIEVGASLGVGEYSNNTFGLYMINGYRFNKHFFAGIGTGFGYSNTLTMVNIINKTTTESRGDAYLIPVFINLKANLTDSKTSPFLQLNTGFTFDADQYPKDSPGLMIEPSFGVDFNIGNNNSIYVMTGFNLQNNNYLYLKDIGTASEDWEVSTKKEMFKAISLRIGIKF